jgi:hypothetical protein
VAAVDCGSDRWLPLHARSESRLPATRPFPSRRAPRADRPRRCEFIRTGCFFPHRGRMNSALQRHGHSFPQSSVGARYDLAPSHNCGGGLAIVSPEAAGVDRSRLSRRGLVGDFAACWRRYRSHSALMSPLRFTSSRSGSLRRLRRTSHRVRSWTFAGHTYRPAIKDASRRLHVADATIARCPNRERAATACKPIADADITDPPSTALSKDFTKATFWRHPNGISD